MYAQALKDKVRLLSVAAANIALAAGRPLVVPDSEILRSLEGVCVRVDEHEPSVYARAALELLSDAPRRQYQAGLARAWTHENSHVEASRRLPETCTEHVTTGVASG